MRGERTMSWGQKEDPENAWVWIGAIVVVLVLLGVAVVIAL